MTKHCLKGYRFKFYASTAFRVCVINPQSSTDRPYGPNAYGSIVAEAPSWPATWYMARRHLVWGNIRTPFISIFDQYRRALNWAQMLEQKGCICLHIVVIDIYQVPQGHMWDAHQIAKELGFPDDRLRFDENEYLCHGSIKCDRVLAIVPAMGPRIRVPVHMGEITLARSCLEAIGSQDIDTVKTFFREQLQWRCGSRDEILLQQIVHALCTSRWD
jgi:hypothetical protein